MRRRRLVAFGALMVFATGCGGGSGESKSAKSASNSVAKTNRSGRVTAANTETPLEPTPKIVGDWQVSVDPPHTTWALADGKAPPFKLSDDPKISSDMLTRINSPFLTMFKSKFGSQHVRVFDLRDGSKLGDFPVEGMFQYNFSPSTDGKHVVTVQLQPRQGVVHSVALGEVVSTFPLLSGEMDIDFLDAARLIVLEVGRKTARVIDVKTGETSTTIELGFVYPGRDRYEISPGGNTVAVVHSPNKEEWRVQFFDLRDGSELGTISIPVKRNWRGEFDMAFSADGSEFACLRGDRRVRVFCCDIASGKAIDSIDVAMSEKKNVANSHAQARKSFRGESLMFTPDNSGWLIQGHLLLDRKEKQLTWAVPFVGSSGYTGPYRFVGNDLLMISADRQAIPESKDESFWVLKWPPN